MLEGKIPKGGSVQQDKTEEKTFTIKQEQLTNQSHHTGSRPSNKTASQQITLKLTL